MSSRERVSGPHGGVDAAPEPEGQPDGQASIIRLDGVSKRYDGKTVLDSLSLDIVQGRFVTLLGPSGCGKTTTLRILAGFIAPDAGAVQLDGRVVSTPERQVPPEQRDLGMVFQNYAVWPHRTVFGNISYGLRLRRLDSREIDERVDAMATTLGLQGLLERYPHELSGGQQQRVALARSLVMEPSVLLLDEPLSNLDAKLRVHLRGELRELQRRTGVTFVYVTHDQAEAMSLSHRIAVLDNGVLQQYADPVTIYQRPANTFVAEFMGHVDQLEGTVVVTGSGVFLEVAPRGRLGLPSQYGSREGMTTTVAFRPESVDLVPVSSSADARPVGVVRDVDFVGSIANYDVELGSQRLQVIGPPRRLHEPGARVSVAVPLDAFIEIGLEGAGDGSAPSAGHQT